MRASVAVIAVVAAALCWLAGPAPAAVPNPANSTIDGDLMLGNARGLAILPLAGVRPTVTDGYRVVVRDVNNVPLAGSAVSFEFAGTGLRPHATQTGGQTADCGLLTVTKLTDASGTAVFLPATEGANTSSAPNVIIRADGVLLAAIRFRSVDLVPSPGGTAAVDVLDLDAFRRRFLNVAPHSQLDPECDYATEGFSSGIVDVADLNVFRTEFLCAAGGPTQPPCGQVQCP